MITPIKGKDLVVDFGEGYIGGSTGCTILLSADVHEVSSPTSGRGREYIGGRYSWSIDVACFVKNGSFMYCCAKMGQKVDVNFGIRGADRQAAQAILQECSFAGEVKQFAKLNIKLQGCGELFIPNPVELIDEEMGNE